MLLNYGALIVALNVFFKLKRLLKIFCFTGKVDNPITNAQRHECVSFFPKLAVVLYFKVSNLFNFCCVKMTMLF